VATAARVAGWRAVERCADLASSCRRPYERLLDHYLVVVDVREADLD